MDGLSQPAITRLARRAGVKSLSNECHDTIKNLIGMKLEEVIKATIVVKQTKTIMDSDIYKALELIGYNITESNALIKKTFHNY